MNNSVWIAFLTGGAIVALIQGGFGVVMWILNRRAKKNDDLGVKAELSELKKQNGIQSAAFSA